MDSSKMDLADQKAVEAFLNKDENPKWSKPFPVIGKGTMFFNINLSRPFNLIVRPDDEKDDREGESWIRLHVDMKRVSFHAQKSGQPEEELCHETSHTFFGDNVGIESGTFCTYWLSYDSDHMVIKYGKGYSMKQTTILTHRFERTQENQEPDENQVAFFDPTVGRKVELYEEVNMLGNAKSLLNVEPEVDFDPLPLRSDIPILVKDSAKANLFDLDKGKFIFSSSLPSVCKALYANITGVDVNLDYVHPNVDAYTFPLTDAIRYSLETEGCTLYEKIREKIKKEKINNPDYIYLRVTLGKEYGNSPGVPNILELWPKTHGSVIHNHGNAYGVIRVLHGGLTVYYYNKISESTTEGGNCEEDDPNLGHKELGKVDVKKGDVTWISPRWYQTHRLQNDTEDFSATIQCYGYGTNDNIHWPYFDYLKSCRTIDEFTPASDLTFSEMYKHVMEDYAKKNDNSTAQKPQQPRKKPRTK